MTSPTSLKSRPKPAFCLSSSAPATSVAHIAELRTLNPVLARLSACEMTRDGLMAPLHPGAAEAYKTLDRLE